MRIPLLRSGGDETPVAWWELCCAPLVVPIFFIALAGIAIVSLPIALLYPERTMTSLDFGTPDEQKQVAEWRRKVTETTPFYQRVIGAFFALVVLPFVIVKDALSFSWRK